MIAKIFTCLRILLVCVTVVYSLLVVAIAALPSVFSSSAGIIAQSAFRQSLVYISSCKQNKFSYYIHSIQRTILTLSRTTMTL